MSDFRLYRKKQLAEMRPYIVGEALSDSVSISKEDRENGSPKDGDMIARNSKNHSDQWLVSKEFFEDNYTLAWNTSCFTTTTLQYQMRTLLFFLLFVWFYSFCVRGFTLKIDHEPRIHPWNLAYRWGTCRLVANRSGITIALGFGNRPTLDPPIQMNLEPPKP